MKARSVQTEGSEGQAAQRGQIAYSEVRLLRNGQILVKTEENRR